MDTFVCQNGALYAEGVPISRIAEEYGTPTYIYSRVAITDNVKAFTHALGSLPHDLHYSVKTNSNLAILQLMHGLGCGFETVSGGELARVQKVLGRSRNAANGTLVVGTGTQCLSGAAGTSTTADSTIFSGVGKTDREIAMALTAGVRYICVESAAELWAVRDVAAAEQETRQTSPAPIAVRINPDVDAKTHPHISTGLKENKFGIAAEEAIPLLKAAHADPHLRVVGVSCHIGSQITTLEPFADAAKRLADVARELLDAGLPLQYLGMGGGLGICYRNEKPPSASAYGRVLAETLGPLGLKILLEPGRVIVGNAGVLVSRVVRTKENGGRRFVILDAGMTDLMRPAMYGAYHGIEAVSEAARKRAPQEQDIVGPVCESSDCFAKQRELPLLETDDLVVLRSAGAYGFTMASNFNGRGRPAEVLVDVEKAQLIRRRESIEELWKGEMDLDGGAF